MLRLVMIAVAVLAFARGAAADPVVSPPELDHVITAPTAWVPAAGTVIAWGGLDHTGAGDIDVGYGLGGIAAIDVGAFSDVRAAAGSGGTPDGVYLGRAGFRIGAGQDKLFAGQPAVVVGTRTTFAGDGRRVSDVYAVASRVIGPVRLHAAIDAMDGKASSGAAALGATVRPAFGVELVPPAFPQTTLMVDIAWLPWFDGAATKVEYAAGGGVRYQALSWGAIELDVRAREGEGLGDTRVMVRLDGVWAK